MPTTIEQHQEPTIREIGALNRTGMCSDTTSVTLTEGQAAPIGQLLTYRDIGKLCGVNAKTARQWHYTGRLGPLPACFDPVRYHAHEIQAWIAAGLPFRGKWRAVKAAQAVAAGKGVKR